MQAYQGRNRLLFCSERENLERGSMSGGAGGAQLPLGSQGGHTAKSTVTTGRRGKPCTSASLLLDVAYRRTNT